MWYVCGRLCCSGEIKLIDQPFATSTFWLCLHGLKTFFHDNWRVNYPTSMKCIAHNTWFSFSVLDPLQSHFKEMCLFLYIKMSHTWRENIYGVANCIVTQTIFSSWWLTVTLPILVNSRGNGMSGLMTAVFSSRGESYTQHPAPWPWE